MKHKSTYIPNRNKSVKYLYYRFLSEDGRYIAKTILGANKIKKAKFEKYKKNALKHGILNKKVVNSYSVYFDLIKL